MDRPRGPRMPPQSMFSQQENTLQQFDHDSVTGLLPPIEPDCVPKTYPVIFGQPTNVDCSYPNFQGEDTPCWLTGLYNIFVGDLGDEVTTGMLLSFFCPYETCVGARVMLDPFTFRPQGFGFATFRTREDAQSAINDLNGKLLGSRRIRCHWPTEGAGAHLNKHYSFLNGSPEDGKEMPGSEAPKNDPSPYTNVFGQPTNVDCTSPNFHGEDTPSCLTGLYNIFVGDLGDEVTTGMLLSFFCPYETCVGARVMLDPFTFRPQGFGFATFRTREDAQSAINDLNGKLLGSRRIRCHWPTEGAGAHLNKHCSFLNGSPEDGKEMPGSEAPKNDPSPYTTVYGGNLSP